MRVWAVCQFRLTLPSAMRCAVDELANRLQITTAQLMRRLIVENTSEATTAADLVTPEVKRAFPAPTGFSLLRGGG